MLDRQRDRLGGIKWGAAFFGWLTAVGTVLILTALAAAAGTAFGLATLLATRAGRRPGESSRQDPAAVRTATVVSATVVLVNVLIGYYWGGYVAGRMARFNGGKQGSAVWLWSIDHRCDPGRGRRQAAQYLGSPQRTAPAPDQRRHPDHCRDHRRARGHGSRAHRGHSRRYHRNRDRLVTRRWLAADANRALADAEITIGILRRLIERGLWSPCSTSNAIHTCHPNVRSHLQPSKGA
ncbi:hypothetical protein AB0F91_46455 [Amycolatopsis sp. NPDC023774]|uniref:hypothetical protein n=1 Tax=Amycolatopsis sp. NPDC023774 TaxID=3155015 RepID=UPI0033C062A2